MRPINRRYGRRRRHALGLDAGLVETCLASCHRDTLAGKRDAALIMTLYDTLCRRSGLAALDVDDRKGYEYPVLLEGSARA
jgi:integrase